ncbi:synaptic vesicle 2-related protein [Planoprotostelium fungivorum]|uniref:Synaptic vesicle 2-related protein n=1 Tax=Planoprotostelium fungivorum TaxID=1890364 RepID=A0A2P6N9A0_9EUKA|nr:synaptic vesicle 2-related protein [Planoprotostelium fungivorum]
MATAGYNTLGNEEDGSLDLHEAVEIRLILALAPIWLVDASEMIIIVFISPALACQWSLSPFQEASASTFIFIGMIIGSLIWGVASDTFGRRFTTVGSTLSILIGGLGASFSPNYYSFVAFRTMVGSGVGGAHVSIALALELLPTAKRDGSDDDRSYLLALVQFLWAAGVSLTCLLAWLMMPSLGWRWLLAVSTVPSLIVILCSPVLSESPRFLAGKGKMEEANKVFTLAARMNKRNSPGPLKKTREAEEGSLRELFAPQLRLLMLLLFVISFGNSFLYYGMLFLTSELLSTAVAGDPCSQMRGQDYLDFFLSSCAEWVGAIFTTLAVDRLGRKWTMFFLFFLGGLSTLTVIFTSHRPMVVASLLISRACITGCFQASGLYIPEAIPTTVRSTGTGSCNAASRLGGIATPFIAQMLWRTNRELSILVYVGAFGVAALCAIFLPRETKGKPVQESVIQWKTDKEEK